jgi:hypothetical protein
MKLLFYKKLLIINEILIHISNSIIIDKIYQKYVILLDYINMINNYSINLIKIFIFIQFLTSFRLLLIQYQYVINVIYIFKIF